ncbi:helicase-exonuclease AddAB subunit AddA [Pseudalkalibacillus caeni]|uniref:ATP-dependent helicase/nuclease subunit A n=1 Tax=Exobacillus caeni TaxID=2574798 RepID=A0A5R9F2Q0_9BACL|nr:helicase-exonuclease AddAB subunit AddA [Pseudalkalibacillus caeni]TLS37877.1 helicase-exonuclease AddAB subunit AddA [Pseudalkalibacillus caeni]
MNDLLKKPEGSTWTDEQWEAIASRNQDILVAAAAGSGKTAVLVERIIRRITDESDPAEVDRLLIVTFTNAAAAEMRKRIGDALEKQLKEQPSSVYLRRQLSLINRASISTLHSFCMEVLRRYYYKVDLDPGFRVADDTEASLLREEALEELFEENYSQEDNEKFFDLVDRYSTDRSDVDLQLLVEKLYNFSRSHPWPNSWLDEMASKYDDTGDFENLSWISEIIGDVKRQLKGFETMYEKAIEIAYKPGGPEPYLQNLEEELTMVRLLLQAAEQSWEKLYEAFKGVKFGRLKSCKGDQYESRYIDQVKVIRDSVKKSLGSLKEDLFEREPEEYLEDLKALSPVIRTLVSLVKEFGLKYQSKKQEKGLVDYADLEHYCLAVLLDEKAVQENPVPSDAASDFRKQFVEVLVDEYQDTNLVQETILKLVSESEEDSGNLFMVGDVKQSIYRFRLAEPGLFLMKYKMFTKAGEIGGKRIDLAKNFRSRSEVLDGTNFVFKQIMNEDVGEIEYDRDAELVQGTEYPHADGTEAELLLINRTPADDDEEEQEGAELEKVQLEARLLAKKIKGLLGKDGGTRTKVFDKKGGYMRPIEYRDIVILLRATSSWAPTILEELKQAGIPSYAELSTGYFDATEVSVMMSLLKVIDNPYQDIPLAAVLRSPIVGLSEEELARIRIHDKKASYFQALKHFLAETTSDNELNQKLGKFVNVLNEWRARAREGALSDLIWQLYRETKYFDFVGGLPGGIQRQANLRALYDRARQYESTSFRGLFRFLRFIERMQEQGGDLGTARALGEQEDVVRLMTIHKSKGLEFPVVFLAGISKQFNMRDLNDKFLLHKEIGFGTKYIDPIQRISYPTLPLVTIQKRMKMELIAEEMRVLYVALTRSREKLYLVGTVNDFEKEVQKWLESAGEEKWILPDYERAKSKSYLDWIGPSLIRHRDLKPLRERYSVPETIVEDIYQHPSTWKFEQFEAGEFSQIEGEAEKQEEAILSLIRNQEPVHVSGEWEEQINRQLKWQYPHSSAVSRMSKQTVTEIKRQKEIFDDERSDKEFIKQFQKPIAERPKFLQSKSLTPAEKGTAMHIVMQHLVGKKDVTSEMLEEQITMLEQKELLTREQAEAIERGKVLAFFHSDLGSRVLDAKKIHKEIPFSLGVPADWANTDWKGDNETVLLQGVIDCILEEEDGLVLIDYKTDNISGRFTTEEHADKVMRERYRVQLDLYASAVQQIWKKPCKEKIVYYFDSETAITI